jgi:hypothetical protein
MMKSAKLGPANRTRRGTEKDVANAYNSVFNSSRRTGKRTSLVVDPPDGKIPPLTAEAEKRQTAIREYLADLLQGSSGGRPGPVSPRKNDPPPAYNVDRMNRADGPEDRSSRERCIGTVMPVFTGQDFWLRLVQSPGQLAMYYEDRAGGGNRVVPVNGSPHLPSRIRQYWGDPRGRWEGATLVVDTTNFTPRTSYRGSRETLHLIERFTRVNATTIDYRITFDDPATWTRPWTVAVELTKHDERHNRIFESACHEGNYGLPGMLANTRAAEKAFAEGKGPNPALQDLASPGSGE